MQALVKERNIQFQKIEPFRMNVKYVESDPNAPENRYDSHIHKECEILVHISGDINFNVENRIYPVLPGNVIITRPYEYHHCIYKSARTHKHFCISLSSDSNEDLLDIFFKRKAGEKNLLVFGKDDSKQLIKLCYEMLDSNNAQLNEYCNFFRLMQFLKKAMLPDLSVHSNNDVIFAMTYMNEHISEKISIEAIAKLCNVSVNTLERHFAEMLDNSPSQYLRQKRLAKAKELLAELNVSETCDQCGFADISAFVSQFRKAFGITPLQYKKQNSKNDK